MQILGKSLLVTEMMKINFILKSHVFSISVLLKWILSVCLNIHTLKLSGISKGCQNEIARLKKLKELEVWADKASRLNEVTLIASRIMTTLLTSSQIFRSCRQVEMLWMDVTYLPLSNLAELEPAENMTDITLRWQMGHSIDSIEKVLAIVKRWRHLKRLKLQASRTTVLWNAVFSVPPLYVLHDFILGMKNLSYLHIALHFDRSNSGQLEVLRDKVNESVLPLRPNFKFEICDI